jgi:hypothetical protein
VRSRTNSPAVDAVPWRTTRTGSASPIWSSGTRVPVPTCLHHPLHRSRHRRSPRAVGVRCPRRASQDPRRDAVARPKACRTAPGPVSPAPCQPAFLPRNPRVAGVARPGDPGRPLVGRRLGQSRPAGKAVAPGPVVSLPDRCPPADNNRRPPADSPSPARNRQARLRQAAAATSGSHRALRLPPNPRARPSRRPGPAPPARRGANRDRRPTTSLRPHRFARTPATSPAIPGQAPTTSRQRRHFARTRATLLPASPVPQPMTSRQRHHFARTRATLFPASPALAPTTSRRPHHFARTRATLFPASPALAPTTSRQRHRFARTRATLFPASPALAPTTSRQRHRFAKTPATWQARPVRRPSGSPAAQKAICRPAPVSPAFAARWAATSRQGPVSAPSRPARANRQCLAAGLPARTPAMAQSRFPRSAGRSRTPSR